MKNPRKMIVLIEKLGIVNVTRVVLTRSWALWAEEHEAKRRRRCPSWWPCRATPPCCPTLRWCSTPSGWRIPAVVSEYSATGSWAVAHGLNGGFLADNYCHFFHFEISVFHPEWDYLRTRISLGHNIKLVQNILLQCCKHRRVLKESLNGQYAYFRITLVYQFNFKSKNRFFSFLSQASKSLLLMLQQIALTL